VALVVEKVMVVEVELVELFALNTKYQAWEQLQSVLEELVILHQVQVVLEVMDQIQQ
tara:strand:+ start:80 stop:250 length:171 start_codon:yes stop_codon:yes gene_type:complete